MNNDIQPNDGALKAPSLGHLTITFKATPLAADMPALREHNRNTICNAFYLPSAVLGASPLARQQCEYEARQKHINSFLKKNSA